MILYESSPSASGKRREKRGISSPLVRLAVPIRENVFNIYIKCNPYQLKLIKLFIASNLLILPAVEVKHLQNDT